MMSCDSGISDQGTSCGQYCESKWMRTDAHKGLHPHPPNPRPYYIRYKGHRRIVGTGVVWSGVGTLVGVCPPFFGIASNEVARNPFFRRI